MLDHPFYHGLATDPRAIVRKMYNSEQMEFYPLSDHSKVDKYIAAKVTDTSNYYRKITHQIRTGMSPTENVLVDPITIMARGHHLRINDVMSSSVNTMLARMMDSGVVAKIFSKYFLSNGKTP